MKITDEVIKALNKCIEACGSKSALAQRAKVHRQSLTFYLTRKRKTITKKTWLKLYPWVKPFLPSNSKDNYKGDVLSKKNLTSNQKILLDAFAELPEELQEQKLIEIVNLAKEEIRRRNKY